jgi:protoheme IX farnesyltransferase
VSTRVVSLTSTASDLLSLTKPRLSSLVLFTMAGGMWLAPTSLSPARAVAALLATAGIIAAANALNCYLERDVDRYMKRTRNRPLPSGRMDPPVALWFGISLAAISIPALVLATNVLTALLGLAALALYVLAYTPLKARSWTAMLVGAVPGALPTLMGWTAATGSIALPGLVLFAVLFLWQIPHFLAIALFCKEEYAAAHLKSLPLQRGDAVSRAHIVAYCAVLGPVAFSLYPLKAAGPIYAASAIVLGAAFLAVALYGFWRRLGPSWARQLFYVSLLYMAGLFTALWVDGGARASGWMLP